MRYYVRTGRRSGVSMPLWVAVVGYMILGALALAVMAAFVALVVAALLLRLLVTGGELAVSRWHQRRAPKT
jgi:hypothetical protein